ARARGGRALTARRRTTIARGRGGMAHNRSVRYGKREGVAGLGARRAGGRRAGWLAAPPPAALAPWRGRVDGRRVIATPERAPAQAAEPAAVAAGGRRRARRRRHRRRQRVLAPTIGRAAGQDSRRRAGADRAELDPRPAAVGRPHR